MLKHKAFKFRLYPTDEQTILINKTIGCSRFVYNHYLNHWNEVYKETGKGLSYSKCNKDLTSLKKQEENIWLKEVDSTSLQASLRNLADSFARFFSKQNNYPRFKSKKNSVQSYKSYFTNNNIEVVENKIKLPKLGWVKFAKSREVEGRILSATIRRKPSGKYFVSVLCEVDIRPMKKTHSSVGIDVGLKDFAILSDGTIYKNPRHFRKLEKKLAKEQKILSRRYRQARKDGKDLFEAKNYQKQRLKVAKLYEKMVNCRTDYLHKISYNVVKIHDLIGIEDLQVSNMLKNKRLSKAISEVSWAEFRTMLEYKADWYGKQVISVARNFPSSQLCSKCGHQHKAVKSLAVREWECPECHVHHDRDLNASKNIEKEALRLTSLQPQVLRG